jgi:hypothetical protein
VSTAVFDKALELLAPGAALAANGSSTGVLLYPRFLPTCDWVIYASGTVGTGTYTFNLQVSDIVGGTYTTISTITWPPTLVAGRLHTAITGDQAAFFDTDSRYIRINYAIGGTTPGIVIGSFLALSANRAGWAYKPGDIITVS